MTIPVATALSVRCPAGHTQVCVTRGTGLKRVCAECLGGAVRYAEVRDTTVNDFLARWEGDGQLPPLRPAEAEAANVFMQAAEVLHAEVCPGSCRKVIKDVAKANHTTTKAVMLWSMKQLAGGLEKLTDSLQAA